MNLNKNITIKIEALISDIEKLFDLLLSNTLRDHKTKIKVSNNKNRQKVSINHCTFLFLIISRH
jgi:hypothetical protein